MAKKKGRRVEENYLSSEDDYDELPAKSSKKPTKKKSKAPAPEAEKPCKAMRKTASLQDRHGVKHKKLSNIQKSRLEAWSGENRGRMLDTYFVGLADGAKSKFGHHSVHAGSESNQLIVGIPMPTIALEHVLGQDVLPLSVIIMLVGRWRTCKSALLYEIMRWFNKFGGGSILAECESKFSPDLLESILWELIPRFIMNKCHSVEGWMDVLTHYIKEQKKIMTGTADTPGPGRTVPVCFGVDSMMGKSSIEKQEKISTEGHASRAFPVEALKITEYLRAMSHEFDNWPFTLILVNHLKQAIDRESGETSRRTPGGEFASFQESFELETSVWKEKINTETFDGTGIRIACYKNSFGNTGRKCKTRMLWWDEPVGQDVEGVTIYKQRTVWDWDWSTINYLSDVETKYKARIKEAGFDLQTKSPTADVSPLARSSALGMGKDTWLPFQEVGAMIRENSTVMGVLRTALGIKRRALLEGDYLQQIENMSERLQ